MGDQALQKWEGTHGNRLENSTADSAHFEEFCLSQYLYSIYIPSEASRSFNSRRSSLSHQMLLDFVIRIVAEKVSMTC